MVQAQVGSGGCGLSWMGRPPAALPPLQAPAIPVVRRHSRGEGQFHFAPAVQVRLGEGARGHARLGVMPGRRQAGDVRGLPRLELRALHAGLLTLPPRGTAGVVSGNCGSAPSTTPPVWIPAVPLNGGAPPPVKVVSGNYVTAKRRGVVNGIDFGAMHCLTYLGQILGVLWLRGLLCRQRCSLCACLHWGASGQPSAPSHCSCLPAAMRCCRSHGPSAVCAAGGGGAAAGCRQSGAAHKHRRQLFRGAAQLQRLRCEFVVWWRVWFYFTLLIGAGVIGVSSSGELLNCNAFDVSLLGSAGRGFSDWGRSHPCSSPGELLNWQRVRRECLTWWLC